MTEEQTALHITTTTTAAVEITSSNELFFSLSHHRMVFLLFCVYTLESDTMTGASG
jgi:hypothetical protein